MKRQRQAKRLLLPEIFGLDLRALAIFRIGLAIFILYDLGSRALDLTAHYTDLGTMPRVLAAQYFSGSRVYTSWNPTIFSVHMLTGSTIGIAAIFLLHAVAAIALLAGYRPRLMAFIVWFLLCSLHARNPLVLSVGDDVLRILLFFAIFLPLDSRKPEIYSSPATAAFYLQLICVYFFAALLKKGPEWHSERTALYYAFSFDQFALPLAQSLLKYPELLKILTTLAWWVELLGAFVLLIPNRIAKLSGVLLLAALQLGIGATLAIGHNPWINLIALIPFLPLPGRMPPIRVQKFQWREGLAVFFLAGVLVYNAAWLVPLGPLASVFDFPVLFVRLEQYWGMFAPAPSREDGWYVVEGRMRNGTKVEAFREIRDVRYDKPKSAADFFPNERWRRYVMNLGTRDFKDFRLPFSKYLCTRWNGKNSGPDHLESLGLYFVREVTPPPGQPQEPNRVDHLSEFVCTP